MAKDAATVAQNWANRLGQSGQAITDGINRVQVAPGQAAARQKAVWVNNTTASANKWAANTAAVTVEEWRSAMIEKGVPRIGQGATAAIPKMQAFMAKALPYIESAVASLPARGDFAANKNRMIAFSDKMHAFKK